MYKIRKIKFKDHPILKNLELDFCGQDGKAVDTVIIAGENGTGKSTLINELYRIASNAVKNEIVLEITDGSRVHELSYYLKHFPNRTPPYSIYVKDGYGMDTFLTSDQIKHKYPFSGIFSDVDINFTSQDISSVTSLDLDMMKTSRRSTTDLPKQINQLLIDIQTLDDTSLASAVREAWNTGSVAEESKIGYDTRMPRFTNAFNTMFEKLTYSRVTNQNNHKTILFQKNGKDIPIEKLSSGEKQIVYRGCFLLKDANAMNGAFVFIDEPEISLHPNWQMKIMDYYKGIFTNEEGVQTSQIFAVTHSPFVIHNDNRNNDKIIVLARDENGDIVVKDRPEYFKCDSTEVIQDAFSIKGFSGEKSVVYLEGRTDEKYFNKAVEVFGYENLPFEFQWIGYMKNEKDEENTGKDALNKAVAFLIGRNLSVKNICLFDCDTARQETVKNNVYTRVIPTYTNSKRMKKGIENALVLDSVDITPYYSTKVKEGDYGDDNTIVTLEKMDMCDAICALNHTDLRLIMANLKMVIDSLIEIFEEK